MNRIIIILFLMIVYAANAQVGWGDMAHSPREIFAMSKIWEAEKKLKLKKVNHFIDFGYKKGPKEGSLLPRQIIKQLLPAAMKPVYYTVAWNMQRN
jgi:hypothetical protein